MSYSGLNTLAALSVVAACATAPKLPSSADRPTRTVPTSCEEARVVIKERIATVEHLTEALNCGQPACKDSVCARMKNENAEFGHYGLFRWLHPTTREDELCDGKEDLGDLDNEAHRVFRIFDAARGEHCAPDTTSD